MPTRRDFLLSCLAATAAVPTTSKAAAAAAELPPVEIVPDTPTDLPSVTRVLPVTRGPKHHFVGYYGITPWNAAGDRLFCLEADVGDRLVNADDRATVCLIDAGTGALRKIAQTNAWNLQQGTMLHWLPTAPDRTLVYNERVKGRLFSRIKDVTDGREDLAGEPVAAIAPDGKSAIGLNFDRLRQIRPVTGYAGGNTTAELQPRPAHDGLFAINMDHPAGNIPLLISIADAARVAGVPDDVATQLLWLEHPAYSRDGSRLFFLARAFHPKSRTIVSVPLVAHAADGSNLRPLLPWAPNGASHYDWLDGHRLVLTRETAPGQWRHLLVDTAAPTRQPRELAPDVLTRDGHCTVSPDGRWMVTDTYPDKGRRQHLYVMDVSTNKAARLASFHAPEKYKGDYRCDLHPRWNRAGTQLCIDSTHDGIRQVYTIDLRMPDPLKTR